MSVDADFDHELAARARSSASSTSSTLNRSLRVHFVALGATPCTRSGRYCRDRMRLSPLKYADNDGIAIGYRTARHRRVRRAANSSFEQRWTTSVP